MEALYRKEKPSKTVSSAFPTRKTSIWRIMWSGREIAAADLLTARGEFFRVGKGRAKLGPKITVTLLLLINCEDGVIL